MTEFVTRIVGSMFGKFDRKSVVGALVETCNESLDYEPGPKLHIGELANECRIQILQRFCFYAH
jgi:hypothetical protein